MNLVLIGYLNSWILLLLVLSFSLTLFIFPTFGLLLSFCRKFCFNHVILIEFFLLNIIHFYQCKKFYLPNVLICILVLILLCLCISSIIFHLNFFFLACLVGFFSILEAFRIFHDPWWQLLLTTRPLNFDWKLCDLWCLQWVPSLLWNWF